MHPLVVREGNVLVAGERRLRAMRDLHQLGVSFRCNGAVVPPTMIPTLSLGELSPLAAMEAELEENIRRTDLTWKERSAAVARVAEIRAAQAEAAGLPPPTVADIALEVRGSSEGANQSYTRMEIILAKHLDNPEVSKSKSVEEAFKVLKRQEVERKNAILGEQYGRDFTHETHTLRQGDAHTILPGLPPSSFDVLITDPPYGMGADEFGDSGGLAPGSHGYTDGDEAVEHAMKLIYEEAPRLLKPEAHIYVFCDIDRFADWRETLTGAGFRVFRTPIIWHKPNGIRAPWPEHGPQRRYELVIYGTRGNRPVTKLLGDVIGVPTDDNLGHGAQKPVGIYQALLERSVRPGDSVLDPFCGTGTVFPAAHALKCRATGVDRDPGSCGISLTRIQSLR